MENNNWETLVADEDYEINTKYPYQIRRKKNGKTVSEYEEKNGYIRLTLNGKKYLKHRLIAIQWIDNPDSFGEVDHYDKVRNNNMIDNLHWCSSSTNNRNRSKANGVEYNFVDEISENSITVSHYGNHEFEDLFYDIDADLFYYYNGRQYKELYINENINGSLYVNVYDVNGKRTCITYSKFKRLHNLI